MAAHAGDLEKHEIMARTIKVIQVTQAKISCLVTQCDDICYSFKFKDDAKGQDVMDEVCDKLGIVEKDYFGLQYTNSRGEIHWLNMRNRVCRQLNKPEPYSLMFCVKFYVQPHQLLQESARRQFFLNVRQDLLSVKYHPLESEAAKLYALLAQADAGNFRENHISYNPSKTASWSPDFRAQVILEHCKLRDMAQNHAEFYCLKAVAELEDYGMAYHVVKSEDNRSVLFGIGIDCLKIEREVDTIQRVPYTCLRMATHSGKTVKLDIYTTDICDVENVLYRLNSKEAACALYRSITEHHAFYRCDSVRPAVKEQVARDFFDTFLSWFHHDDNNSEQNYIFDTERTCREAYDHARRILYNFGASTAAAMTVQKGLINSSYNEDRSEVLQRKVEELTDQIDMLKDSLNCTVCRDRIVDVVLQCGHPMCAACSELCGSCPLCRAEITNKTKFYLPFNVSGINKDQEMASQTNLEESYPETENISQNVLNTHQASNTHSILLVV